MSHPVRFLCALLTALAVGSVAATAWAQEASPHAEPFGVARDVAFAYPEPVRDRHSHPDPESDADRDPVGRRDASAEGTAPLGSPVER